MVQPFCITEIIVLTNNMLSLDNGENLHLQYIQQR